MTEDTPEEQAVTPAEPYALESVDNLDNAYELVVDPVADMDYAALREDLLKTYDELTADNDAVFHDPSRSAVWFKPDEYGEVRVRFYREEEPSELEQRNVAAYLRGEDVAGFDFVDWLAGDDSDNVTFDEAQALAEEYAQGAEAAQFDESRPGSEGQPRLE